MAEKKNGAMDQADPHLRHARGGVFGTEEWAMKNANAIEGCGHNCLYCYAKTMAIRFGRRTATSWSVETDRLDMVSRVCTGTPCRVMFPSTHDITPNSLPCCMEAMGTLLAYGHSLLVVSKPHLECIEAVCTRFKEFKDKMLFRFTIGSADNAVLSFWEPQAPTFEERVLSLIHVYDAGFQTSVSCEPMLDNNIDGVVSEVLPFVTDAVWIGKANQLRARLKINGASPEIMIRGEELIAWQNDDSIRDLYLRLKDNPKIKWKESIKKVVGLEVPQQAGLDV